MKDLVHWIVWSPTFLPNEDMHHMKLVKYNDGCKFYVFTQRNGEILFSVKYPNYYNKNAVEECIKQYNQDIKKRITIIVSKAEEFDNLILKEKI